MGRSYLDCLVEEAVGPLEKAFGLTAYRSRPNTLTFTSGNREVEITFGGARAVSDKYYVYFIENDRCWKGGSFYNLNLLLYNTLSYKKFLAGAELAECLPPGSKLTESKFDKIIGKIIARIGSIIFYVIIILFIYAILYNIFN